MTDDGRAAPAPCEHRWPPREGTPVCMDCHAPGVPCWACDGTGAIEADEDEDDYEFAADEWDCDLCDGSGVVVGKV